MVPNRMIWNPTGQYVAIKDDIEPYRKKWSHTGPYRAMQDIIGPYRTI